MNYIPSENSSCSLTLRDECAAEMRAIPSSLFLLRPHVKKQIPRWLLLLHYSHRADDLCAIYFPVLPCPDPSLPLNQYIVTVRTTEASLRCHLAGEYLVSIENKALLLLEINSSSIIYEWPYICIRKFGQVKVNIYF